MDLLEQLENQYPNVDVEFLLEVLTTCKGDMSQAVSMLDESLGSEPLLKKRRANVQSTISSFLEGGKPGVKSIPETPGKPRLLHTKEDIEDTIKYVTYHPKFLPNELADRILKHALSQDRFKSNQFYLFGNKCTASHQTMMFSEHSSEYNESKLMYNGKPINNVLPYNDDLKMAQLLIEDFVNEEMAKRELLPFQIKPGEWRGSTAVTNRYYKDSTIDWHSDRMSHSGAHAVIASLTLGCSREFRMRKQYPSNSQVYSMNPQHNSLLIMHAGCQEEYKHCVPHKAAKASLEKHPIAGDIRINFTYRHFRDDFSKHVPHCDLCDASMELKRTYKDKATRGRYMWFCAGSYKGKECKGVKYANFSKRGNVSLHGVEDVSTWLDPEDTEALQAQGKV